MFREIIKPVRINKDNHSKSLEIDQRVYNRLRNINSTSGWKLSWNSGNPGYWSEGLHPSPHTSALLEHCSSELSNQVAVHSIAHGRVKTSFSTIALQRCSLGHNWKQTTQTSTQTSTRLNVPFKYPVSAETFICFEFCSITCPYLRKTELSQHFLTSDRNPSIWFKLLAFVASNATGCFVHFQG